MYCICYLFGGIDVNHVDDSPTEFVCAIERTVSTYYVLNTRALSGWGGGGDDLN